jgi:mannose-6-phosphate isomerase-like protein (cupin superfamily)
MLTANQTLDLSPIGMLMHIKKTAAETNGQSLEIEWELLPHADGTPVHIHPSARESYKVLEGVLEVNVNSEWKKLQVGDEYTVAAGTAHTFRNPTNAITRVYNTHAPAMKFDEYFQGLQQIVAKFSTGNERLKMNFNTATYLSMLMSKYKQEIRTLNPPPFMVALLNAIGKLRGLKV